MKTFKTIAIVLVLILVTSLSVGFVMSSTNKSSSSSTGANNAKLTSAINELSGKINEQQSVNEQQHNDISSINTVNEQQQSNISSINSAIDQINLYNRDFVTVPDPDTEYSFFDRSCGTIKRVGLRSGDNYVDFYDSNGEKVSNLTYNLSKNDVLLITFYQNGARATFAKFHDGSDVSMKDYVASSTETLSFAKFANDRELFVSIS